MPKITSRQGEIELCSTIESRLPYAEVSPDGVVRRLNALGEMAWGWEEGTHVPRHLEIALVGVSRNDPTELPVQFGGLMMGVIPNPEGVGWTLIGYAPQEESIRSAMVKRGRDSEDSHSPNRPIEAHGKLRVSESGSAADPSVNLSKDRMAFIATLSHEIRSPIGAIAGYTDLLQKELTEFAERSNAEIPVPIFEFLRTMTERISSLQRVVKDLFELSALSNRDVEIDRTPIDLNELVRFESENCRDMLDSSRVDLKLELMDTPIFLETDVTRLGRVIHNVLMNAIKFTDSGEITVRSRYELAYAVLEIDDTGVGISHEFIAKIFDAFSQEDSRPARAYEGVGMGLALSKRIIELLGGRIEVESTKGRGSLFRIMLPIGYLNHSEHSDGRHFQARF